LINIWNALSFSRKDYGYDNLSQSSVSEEQQVIDGIPDGSLNQAGPSTSAGDIKSAPSQPVTSTDNEPVDMSAQTATDSGTSGAEGPAPVDATATGQDGSPARKRPYVSPYFRADGPYSLATPLFQDGTGNILAEVVGQDTANGFEPGPVFSHGSMFFEKDEMRPMPIPIGSDMIMDQFWDTTHFNMDEAACLAIGDVRARFPVLFELMRMAGAPVAQMAREILRRERRGYVYYVQIFYKDPLTGRMENHHGPPPSF
jgi:hypothetical protein